MPSLNQKENKYKMMIHDLRLYFGIIELYLIEKRFTRKSYLFFMQTKKNSIRVQQYPSFKISLQTEKTSSTLVKDFTHKNQCLLPSGQHGELNTGSCWSNAK